MGGLLHLIHFNQRSMAKKVLAHKRHVGGLEAPRNSLELPAESSQDYYSVTESVPHSFQGTREWSENKSYPTEASMKKLISEEISKGPGPNTRRNAPSIVARLMGMDMLPLDTESVAQSVDKKNEKQGNFPRKERNKKGSGGLAHCNSNSSRQIEYGSFHYNEDGDPDRLNGGMKSKKLKPREHPQEEELQKFKKEFEAWQAARFRECSKVVELESIPSQRLAQENLNKEKITFYANSRRVTASETPRELKGHMVKARLHEGGGIQHRGCRKEHFAAEEKELLPSRSRTLSRDFEHSLIMRKEHFPAEQNELFNSRSRTLSRDFEHSPLMSSDQKLWLNSTPTRIVILRPATDHIGHNEKSWASSSGNSEERDSIEDFLEEVKERLKWDLQGKALKRGTVVRGGGIETPHSEKPSDPKKIAQRIAKQVRESVTKDLGMNLLRSESTRSYSNEIQLNGPGSPEFINRDARRFLSERLKNVLKNERHLEIPAAVSGSSSSSMFDNGRGRLKQSGDNCEATNNVIYRDNVIDEPKMQTRSFRCGPDDDVMLHREPSPRNLIRSLSAPVSGTSFGKLLLEDRHVLTGAHIRRKHEVIEKITVDLKKRKKEKFNLREKVSSFKYSFTLTGRLFGRKIQPAKESHNYEYDSMKDMMSGPTVVMNFCDRHENSTEVPPSPASICSSAHEELWRTAENLSPTSSSQDLPPLEDTAVSQVFKEISSNLNELRRQLSQLETDDGSEQTMIEEQPLEAEMVELEDQAEAYIRDLLVVSGLYDGSCDNVLSRRDPFAKHISNVVFEEVEESYKDMAKDNEGSSKDHDEKKVDHKVLLDLLNETLSIVLGPPVTMLSRFRKKSICHMLQPPNGRKLLDRVWEIIRAYVYPPTDKSYYFLDGLMARDLALSPWSGLMNDDVDALGKEMESQIIRDLIEEIVKDMQ
ncbi:uncharacterized protein LOC132266481 [Cornus florida]|uniref:uncharacterized protein LOC132266481 n=1 Tax=Cornus florida TaxID=4283 RepID=UPI002897D9BA|nr:uncharacterized protein LOC132266481 [Cornus florida]XP_059623342.1 uncharacterized protein LOC132266481 [Cornus florida]